MLMDNRKWQCEELRLYFKDMEKRLHKIDNSLYLCPDMAQWGYFLNVDGAMLAGVGFADLWDTAARGIDIYRLAEYVDCAHFISVPVTPDGDADIYVTSCHHSMMRGMNRGREFIGGIYWGRYLYNDLYAVITPCETVASIVAAGAAGYTSYGMCGLDDGGVLHRMEESFHASLGRANAWAKEVIPQLGGERSTRISRSCSHQQWQLMKRCIRKAIRNGGWICWAGIKHAATWGWKRMWWTVMICAGGRHLTAIRY